MPSAPSTRRGTSTTKNPRWRRPGEVRRPESLGNASFPRSAGCHAFAASPQPYLTTLGRVRRESMPSLQGRHAFAENRLQSRLRVRESWHPNHTLSTSSGKLESGLACPSASRYGDAPLSTEGKPTAREA